MRTYENWVEFIHGWKRGGGEPPLVISVGEWHDFRALVQLEEREVTLLDGSVVRLGGRPIPEWPTPDMQILGVPIRLACPHDELPLPPVEVPS